jgi:hypothetical protein
MKIALGKHVIATIVLTLVLASNVYPQEIVKKEEQAAKNELITVIILNISGTDDSLARSSVIEGGALKIIDSKSGTAFAIFPAVDKKNRKNVKIKICSISQDGDVDSFTEIENLEVMLGDSVKSLTTTPKFKIEVEAIIKRLVDGPSFNSTKQPDVLQSKSKPE